MRFSRWSAGAAFLVATIPACAGTAYSLGAAAGYNVFIFSNYSTPGCTEIQGSAAIGGNLTATTGMGFDQTPGSAAPATAGLIVGGNASLASGQLNGDAWIKGTTYSTSTYGSFTITGNLNYGTAPTGAVNVQGTSTKLNSNPLPIDFVSAATSLTQLSNALTNMTVNGTVTGNASNYLLTATNCTLCVFDVTGGTINNVTINAPAGATVVVNVNGASSNFTNGSISYTGGATAATTLFNFGTATTLYASAISFEGSVLAPLATFTGTNGQFDGELIAKAVSGESAQFDSASIFRGNLNSGIQATPEPSTWLTIASALGALVFMRMRAKKHYARQMCYTTGVSK